MDDKTAELRDIFLSVSGEDTVTESQEEGRGSLAGERPVEEQLRDVIARMRERYDFRTNLDTEALVKVVTAYYAGDDDATIAEMIEADIDSVERTRFDLHLLRDDDLNVPFSTAPLRDALLEGQSPETVAETVEVEADTSTLLNVARALATQEEIRSVSDRYREEFEEIIEDRDLRDRLASSLREDGLEDATDGMETNVSF